MAQKLTPKTVRLSRKLYVLLLEEAEETGIGKPAVLARSIIITRLSDRSKWDDLFIIWNKLPVTPVNDPRICIRIPEQHLSLINEAATKIFEGKFAPMVQAILTERYDKNFEG
jgi:hypothetical protein